MKSSGSSWGHCTALVTVAWFATATWTAAFAADPPTKAPAAKQTKTKAKPISRDQLRACMDQQDVINSMREKVLQQQASLDQQRAEVARMDAELARKRTAAAEPADEAATKALNDEEVRRNELSDSYNARLPALKEQASTLEKERQSWVERCAGKDFDELDELAIKRERQRAASATRK